MSINTHRGYLSTQAGKDAQSSINRMLVWDDSFYDEPMTKIKKMLDSTECNGFMYIEHSWKQLKQTMEWYRKQCKLVDYDQDTILREIDLQRIQGNERSPFKKAALVHITRNKKDPLSKIDLSKTLSPIFFYEKLNRKIHYILSVDPAEGLGLNNNAFELINPHTEMVAAEFKSPYISPPDFFRMLVKFMDEYCPKSLVVIEANRGRELINRFIESKYRYQIWYDSKKLTAKVVESTDVYGAAKRSSYERRAFGFDTTASSKPLLFGIIERFMEEDLGKVNTEFIVKDTACVQRMPNGKIVLGAGDDSEGEGHGDNLMAYLIGLFVLYNADNLEEFGVRRGSSMPEDDNRELTDAEKKEQLSSVIGILPPELQEVFQVAINETNPVEESFKYEQEIQSQLKIQSIENNQMVDEDVDPRFYDEGVDEARWDRIQKDVFASNFDTTNQPRFDMNDWI